MNFENGWLVAPRSVQYVEQQEDNMKQITAGYFSFWHRFLSKFSTEYVFGRVEKTVHLIDGLVFNREEHHDLPEEERRSLETYLVLEAERSKKNPLYFSDYDGTFNGLYYDTEADKGVFFTNPLGERTVYYIENGPGGLWVSSNYNWLLRALHECGYQSEMDVQAFRSMVVFGGMHDDRTWDCKIKRLMPGCYLSYEQGRCTVHSYYTFDTSNPVYGVSEAEWIERLDSAFRRAYQAELAVDEALGLTSLIDISGGLDSRMTTLVAADLGVENAVLLSYAAMGSDEQKVAQLVAEKTNFPFLFSGIDDANYAKDIESLLRGNFGAAYYIGITGGQRFLSWLNDEKFGIQHTGLLGDMGGGGYFPEDEGANEYRVNPIIRSGEDHEAAKQCYPNAETFYFYTRGPLWGLSSMTARRNYTESFSPFMSREFLELSHSIPPELRKNGFIFLEWMKKKVPLAASIPQAKGMVAPGKPEWVKQFHQRVIYRLPGVAHRIRRTLCPNHPVKDTRSMNPVGIWVENRTDLTRFMEEHMQRGLQTIEGCAALEDIYTYFTNKNVPFFEKTAFLTAAEAVRRYINSSNSIERR